jgi:hypothetical protein
MNELPKPPEADQDPEAFEILRTWVLGEALECSLRTDTFADPSTWGLLLADVVRYVSEALREHEGLDPADSVQAIRAAFDAELNSPGPTGVIP